MALVALCKKKREFGPAEKKWEVLAAMELPC